MLNIVSIDPKNDNIKIAKFTQTSEDGSSFNVRVCGSQGVFYTVNFHDSFGAQCSCPDFTIRKRNCKHIYFVIGTVAKDEGLFFAINEKPNFTVDELKGMCTHIKNQVNVMYNSHQKKESEKEKIVIERDDPQTRTLKDEPSSLVCVNFAILILSFLDRCLRYSALAISLLSY